MPYAPSSAGLPTQLPVSPSRPHSRPPHSRTLSKESVNDATVLYTAVKSLYDLTGDVKAVFGKHYVPETASFIDPLVTITHDTKACVGQFRALRGLFSRAEIKTRSVTRGGNHLVIDWQIKYFPRGLPSLCAFFLHTITILTLETESEAPETSTGSMRISRHVDHWSLHELLSSVPVLSFFYSTLWRPIFGKSSSFLTNAVCDYFEGRSGRCEDEREGTSRGADFFGGGGG